MKSQCICWLCALLMVAVAPLSASGQTATRSPFDISFGPQDDGTFGAVVKGNHYFPLQYRGLSRVRTSGTLVSLFIGIDADGSWNSAPDALNNVALSLRPSMALQKLEPREITVADRATGAMKKDTVASTRGPWLHLFFDARQRFGHFESELEPEPRRVDQLILGGGAQWRAAGFPDWYQREFGTGRLDNAPIITVAYYSVKKNLPDDESLPEDITADAIVARAQTSLTLPFACSENAEVVEADPNDPFSGQTGTVVKCPFGFVGELVGTKLLGGSKDTDFRVDIGVFYDTGGSFKPILRYRTGQEHGLEYDEQFLIGLLWSLPITR